ncbi:MAG: S-layer homology domain-containing protein [Syntrophorhabdaceae bacterium]|nr:S-layer homology domain-containing protein [Syntrophorhabdaceae bacterium]
MKKHFIILLISCVFIGILMSGCEKPQVAKCTLPEDNPQHHYVRGMEAIEQGRLDVAKEKFERTLYCDETFYPAYGGLAIISAYKVVQQKDPGYSAVDRKRAIDYVENKSAKAITEEDKFDHFISVIRVDTIMDGTDWLDKAESAYRMAKDLKVDERKLYYYQGVEALDYFMGLAYVEAMEFQKAREKFAAVLNAKREGKWHEKADKAWKKMDKIVQAMAGITVGNVGKKIAIKDSITRADLAALLVDELKIDKLFAGRIPVQSQLDRMKPEFTPADMMNHPFRDEIQTVMKWKVRGLEPKYDETTKAYLFKPLEVVKRGEMAFILEDVLIKLTGDEKIATAYFGQERSPFPDIRSTSPIFNAVMNMTTRGIMVGELSGEFRPDDPVTGADALLALRMLKQRMNIF